ncbi:hypothetical protein LOCK900_2649 [Lacticaseibacillus rhamnosus LOCK900]|nr:hypothetical protein LOCK900_2649 [Lacticaseibacillus rhamnosus LOCK900]ASY48578.1 hypothetical protein N507_1403 [Lacticaseibacillus rhamnosus DSM 14870]
MGLSVAMRLASLFSGVDADEKHFRLIRKTTENRKLFSVESG